MTPFARIAVVLLALTMPVVAQQKPIAQQKPVAQTRPDFSGTWVIVSPKEGAGKAQIVTQDDKTLTTERGSSGGGHKMVYQLDGVERRLALPSGAEITMLARAVWNANRIVITSDASYPNGMRTRSTDTWSIDAQGRLVIDSTETGPSGEPGPTVQIIYTKRK